jgi:antitoxin HicB
MNRLNYPVIIVPLPTEDGGGFLASVPDLPGCMSDGETPAEAIENVIDAIEEWIDAGRRLGRDIPEPSRELQLA